jgi:UDP-N-acetylglucosamine 2-epimerase (non-hydrolysing)
VVITDSGGIQEETTYLGIPCLTVRENTKRPITVPTGTNVLVGRDREKLRSSRALVGDPKKRAVPPLWDGHAGERIAEVLVGRLSGVRAAISVTIFSDGTYLGGCRHRGSTHVDIDGT